MSKQQPFLIILLLLSGVVFAQQNSAQQKTFAKIKNAQPVAYQRPNPIPDASLLQPQVPEPVTHSGVNYRGPEEIVGSTFWDAQSYGAMSSHLYANETGEPVATWTFTLQASGQSDRGTGYNARSGGSWPAVDTRLEATRTGFPASVKLSDGTEVVISHTTAFNPFKIWMARRAPGASTWTETGLPQPAGIRMLWPKVAVGGADGKTIHVIAITAPVGGNTGGVIYEGLNGHILYYRSTDGGLNWDISNLIIPGLDQSKFVGFSADTYTIDASGNNVAIAVFPNFNDVMLYKSTDNGQNWNRSVVQDFPDILENYDAMPGVSYSIDDVPVDSFAINNGWSEYAVLSNDGTGSVLIDHDGQAHVWFGRMYVGDETFTDSTTFYYPACDGIFHWEESDGPNNLQLITGVLDYDGDGFIGVTANSEIAQYGGSSLTSFPVSGIDDQGNLYMAYAGLHELYRSGSAADFDQFYRHIYLQRSSDGGTTWSLPYDITNAPYVEAELVPFTEAMWPALPRRIGNNIWVMYQGDYFPGSTIWGNNHAATQTDIRFVEIEKDSLGAVRVFEPAATPDFNVAINPNPAQDVVRIMANTPDAQPCFVEVFDFTGRKVQEQRFPSQNSMNLTVSMLPTGVYQIRVSQGQRFGISRLVKE